MSTTEKQWKEVLDLLQCMTAGQFTTPAAVDAVMKAGSLVGPMARQPATPAKTCTKLVAGLKVRSSSRLLLTTRIQAAATLRCPASQQSSQCSCGRTSVLPELPVLIRNARNCSRFSRLGAVKPAARVKQYGAYGNTTAESSQLNCERSAFTEGFCAATASPAVY